MDDLTSAIKEEALSLGFASVGFAKVGPSGSINEYNKWLAKGYAAEMQYLHRHAPLKTHPENVAPGVESIIAVAARYPTNSHPGKGFSTYARGLDYHDVLRKKLRVLTKFINSRQPLNVHRICIDSAPLLEREWAMRAGIGWQGKQGQLINPVAGSCFVLGFLLVDVALEPSALLENRCGDCRRCIDACPTGAALGESVVDARKCLSYLTIEPCADVTDNLAISGVLFGCDCCTAVCPWNEHATSPIMQEFREIEPTPSAQELQNWTDEDFKNRFKGTAVFRTGLAQLQRNASFADI